MLRATCTAGLRFTTCGFGRRMLVEQRIYDLPMPLAMGETFAGYTILRVLGAGGMGTVYLAQHPRLPRREAVKVLTTDPSGDAEYRARFLREADLAASLSHPHIVAVHDRGEHEGQFWISMDYVDGTDAARLLRGQYPRGMPAGEVLPIISAVGSALDYAHRRGLLHRDVKPANILLTEPDGQARRVYLADFGIARRIDDAAGLTATNMTVGTVAYAAPEQLKGEAIDGRADQYALACTAFHLLTGAPPYADSNAAVVITKHVTAPAPSIAARRPELGGLDPVFARAIAKNPADRFPSCQDFARELHHHLNLAPGASPPPRQPSPPPPPPPWQPSPPPPPPPWAARPVATRRTRRPGVIVAVLAASALVITGGVVAGVKLLGHHGSAATGPTATAAAGAAAFTGTYRADYGPGTTLDGAPIDNAPAITGTWGVRSTCGPTGCVATASYLGGSGTVLVSNLVFDEVGGSWVAVGLGSVQCNDAPVEVWVAFTLLPLPDGTLSGDNTRAASNGCTSGKRSVTFTRTGDIDVNRLPDPATLPPRVVSPAEALHGRYHQATSYSNGGTAPEQDDLTVRTDCLRTGDRCLSNFHAPDGAVTLVFAGGKWTSDDEGDAPCQLGGTAHLKTTAEYPLPDPLQDPIPLLTGHGQTVSTGSTCPGGAFDDTFTRTGD